jgi:hypothetical protein
MQPPINDWLVALIVAVTPIVVAILSWVADRYKDGLPSWSKPIIATVLGSALAYLGSVVSDNPILIAVIGMASIGLREILVRLAQAVGFFPKPFRG